MLAMKSKVFKSSGLGTQVQRMSQLRTDAGYFFQKIGPENVVSICEHMEHSMLVVWYREEE